MRQRRWLELMKDYDLIIHYHLEKANIMANTLNQKSEGLLATLIIRQARLLRDLEEIQKEVRFRNPST